LKTGIIGARGVGKSTVFHALTGLAPLAGQGEGRNRARPGQIKDMFDVDFTRPRDAVKVRETPRYAELFQHIWHSLGEEFVKGRSP